MAKPDPNDARTPLDRARALDVVVVNARVMLAVGHHRAGVVLMRYAMREHGEDARLLRLLAHALDALGRYEEALAALDRLEALEGVAGPAGNVAGVGSGSPVDLLAARALVALGRTDEARRRFARHVSALNRATGVAEPAAPRDRAA